MSERVPSDCAQVSRNGRPIVVGIGGTMRAGSSTEQALASALASAERAGAETLLLNASALQLPLYEPNISLSPQSVRLIAAVRRADGLIIATPGYHGGPSGLVKNALDYLEELRNDSRPYLDGRAVGCIVCASGWQATTTTLVTLRSIVHALRGWPTPLGVAINSLKSVVRESADSDSPIQAQLDLLGRQVTEFAFMQMGRQPSQGAEE
jgi:FMN reductase